MKIHVIHDRSGKIEAVVATNAPEGVSLAPGGASDKQVSELRSHNVGNAKGDELVSKLREIRNSKLSDLDTRPT